MRQILNLAHPFPRGENARAYVVKLQIAVAYQREVSGRDAVANLEIRAFAVTVRFLPYLLPRTKNCFLSTPAGTATSKKPTIISS